MSFCTNIFIKPSLKYFILFLTIHCFFCNVSAQTTNVSGIINSYASVTSVGTQSTNVTTTSGFVVGDKVLLIQMKGASIDTTNTSNFGTITSYNDAGNYEMLVISAISSTTITFTTPILRTYNTTGLLQLVKVPVYNNVNVIGLLTCTPWNGSVGGVLIFEATGNVTLNANIDVTGKGFLGGAISTGQFFSCAGNTTDFKLFNTSFLSSNKGEGIAIIKPSFTKGLGALANGGGAGNDVNGGGAGGGNYGLGGHGGNTKCSTSPIALCGGYEGKSCVYSNANNKIFLGGGGGSGHENDGVSTAGVAGGGIVIIRSGGSILGNGNSINANGNNNTLVAGNDGQGGGGAGGTVLIEACSSSSLNISVIGGNGGTDNFSGPDCHGKGGGGGGGTIWTASALSYTSFLNGGNPGVFTNSNSQCFNTSNGATTGQVGGTLTGLLIPGASSLSSTGSFSLTLTSNCISNNNSTATATVSSSLSSPVFSYTWTNSSGTIISQTNNTTSLVNSVPNLANGIYTLTVQMNAPCGPIITQTLNINCIITPTVPCLGTMTGTGMSICNLYSFNITPTQTITPLNYGSQGYACNNTTQPDVSFNILGGGWRVNKFGWFFSATTAGQVRGYNSTGILQTFTFAPSNTITPLSYSGTFVQLAINGVATGQLLSQTNFSISLLTDVFVGNSYTYCPSTAASIAINPVSPTTGGPWAYNWLPGNLNGSPVNVSPSTSTIYSVTAIAPGGCSSSTTVSVNINCVVTPTPLCSGTLGAPVFFEDFGSGASIYGPPLPSGVTNYTYLQGVPNNGTYVIGGSSNPSGTNAGYVNDPNDHTGNTNGYMMVINSDYPASEVYRKHVTGLCQNTTYVFSGWLSNNNTPSTPTTVCPGYVYANIKFQIEYPVSVIQNSIATGSLPLGLSNTALNWQQYGFAFTTGPGQTSVDVVMQNNAPGGCGNDYVVDDISLAPCGPGVSLSIVPNNTVFCPGSTVALQSTFTSGGYTTPQYQWQYSGDGGITWSDISGATSSNYTISSVTSAQGGMYQLLVSENGNINLSSCRIAAGPLTFSVANGITLSAVSPTICSGNSITLTANGATTYTWSNTSNLSSITVNPSVTSVYTVTGTVGTCTSQAVSTVSVIPSATISVTGNTLICSGQSTTLTASGSSNYIWNSGLTTNSIIVNPIISTSYSVTAPIGVCSNTAVVTVSVLAIPILTLSPNVNICQGVSSSTTLTASGANTYSWANSATLSSSTGNTVVASPNATTNYTVTGVSSICSSSAVVTVSVSPSPTITTTSVNNTFCGLANGSATVTSLPSSNTYIWSSGVLSTTNTASNLAAGNYTITANNGTCQTYSVVSILSSTPLLITSSTVTPSDCNVNNGSIVVTDNIINSTYLWSPNVSSTNVANNLPASNYALTITNGACSTSTIFIVAQSSGPTSLNVTQNDAICESLNGSINILNVVGGTTPYQYDFNNGGYSSVSTYSNLSQGAYTITVKDAHGCFYAQTFSINKLVVNLTIDLITYSPTCNDNDGSYVINSVTSGTPPYETSFNNGLYSNNLLFEQLSTGTYSLSIRDSNMCETPYVLNMLENGEYTLYIPNTFTPNNNTVNDIWFVKGTCLNQFKCIIYNRWGEKIKELNDIKEGWDGTCKGKPVPDGVYVYLIEAETQNGTINKAGHITLFR